MPNLTAQRKISGRQNGTGDSESECPAEDGRQTRDIVDKPGNAHVAHICGSCDGSGRRRKA
jgi:DnaJ-class molecular chaperone